ncbi:MAG: hypothetical protein ACLFRB_06825 [Thiohalorhabdus sp.]|uniref:hypothetical protein n=1 Tax=Thiohalorhabdus sp. TaxID=3094134 RepID=UPI00398033A9
MPWATLLQTLAKLGRDLLAAWRRREARRDVERRRKEIKEERRAIDRDAAGAGRRMFGGVRRDERGGADER